MEEEKIIQLFAGYSGCSDEELENCRLLCQAAENRLRRMLKNPRIEEDAADELNLLAAIWAAGEYLMLQEGERTVKVGEIEISCKDRSEALLSMKDLMMAQNAQWFLENGFHVKMV